MGINIKGLQAFAYYVEMRKRVSINDPSEITINFRKRCELNIKH